MGLRTHAWKFALVIGACAVGGYFALSGVAAHDAITEAVGMAAVLGILVGIRLQHPSDRTGWYLLALGVVGFVGGDCFESIHGLSIEVVDPHPTAATVFYLAGYLFTIAAAIRLSRNPNPSGRREGYADAAIITLGTLAIAWHFLINSYVYDASLTIVRDTGGPRLSGHGPRPHLHRLSLPLVPSRRPPVPQAHRRRPDGHRADRLRP